MMAEKSYFEKLRGRKSVLQRTKKSTALPEFVLYIEWMGSTGKRRVLDKTGGEHVLADGIVETHYKLVPGRKAKAMIAEHWEKEMVKPQAPAVKTAKK